MPTSPKNSNLNFDKNINNQNASAKLKFKISMAKFENSAHSEYLFLFQPSWWNPLDSIHKQNKMNITIAMCLLLEA